MPFLVLYAKMSQNKDQGGICVAPGRKILKVCGILMMIAGILGALIAVSGIMGYKNMDTTMIADMEKIMSVSVNSLITNLMVNALMCVVMVATGIMGVVFSKNTDKAKVCLFFGVIVILFQIGADIYSSMQTGFGIDTVVGLIAGMLIPAIFIMGAWKNIQV